MAESYTEDELLGLYRDGKDDPHILEKLSDLACRPKSEVLALLHQHGFMLDEKPPDGPSRPLHRKTYHTEAAWRQAIECRLRGDSWSKIELETGIPADVARNGWRKWAGKLGVPLPEEAFKPKQTKPFTSNMERSIPVNLENTAAAPETEAAKAPKDRLFEALYTAVGSLKAMTVEDNFSITYIDHRFTVDYSFMIGEEEHG